MTARLRIMPARGSVHERMTTEADGPGQGALPGACAEQFEHFKAPEGGRGGKHGISFCFFFTRSARFKELSEKDFHSEFKRLFSEGNR